MIQHLETIESNPFFLSLAGWCGLFDGGGGWRVAEFMYKMKTNEAEKPKNKIAAEE